MAAKHLFAKHGYEGANVRMIAQEAGVAAGAISYHWGGKEGLWQAVCEHSAKQLGEILQTSVDFRLAPQELVPQLSDALFEAFLTHQELLRIVVWATLEADTMDYTKIRGSLSPLIAFGREYWVHHQQLGNIQVEDLDLALMHFRAVLWMAFVDSPGHRHHFGTDLSDPAHQKRVKKSVTAAFLSLMGIPTSTQKTNTN